jgi:hypothetical protein
MPKTSTLLLCLLCLLAVQPATAQNALDNAGLTAATPASAAYSLRKLSSSYNGFALKIRRSSDNAEANLAFDGSGVVSNASLATLTPGVTVNAALGTARTGTVATALSRTGTITIKVLRTGLISTSNGSATVTGVGTSFTTELAVGDRLFNSSNVFLGIVSSIANSTTLVLNNYATINTTLTSYRNTLATVAGTGTNFTGELAVGDRIFNTTNVYLGTVAGIAGSTALTLSASDATAATSAAFVGTGSTVTGTGTDFTSLSPGDLLISNNITLGTIGSISSATSLTLTTKAGASVTSLAYKSTAGTMTFAAFYTGASVYVNTWYDQSGNGRDAIQLKGSNQPRMVNAGVLYTVNSKPSIEFSTALSSFLQTSTAASYLNSSMYTLNKVTAEATTTPILQLPISTTGGNGPNNTISHYGYRSSSQFTVAQYGNDQNFAATPSTSLELHTAVKSSTASSTFYKNGISLGLLSSGAPSNLLNVGLLNIGYYTPTNSYYTGSISELTVYASALSAANVAALNNSQLAFYNIATTYWTGAVNTDWTNTGNWSTGIVPTITSPDIVVIPAGKPNYPIVAGTSPANSISVEAGASVTVTGTLQIAGTINNAGTFTASSGTIQYLGTAPQNIQSNTFASNTVKNIIVNNPTGVTAGGNLTISGNLTFASGTMAISGVTLTLSGTVTNTVSGGFTGSSNGSMVIAGTSSLALSFDQTTPGTSNALKSLTINSTGQVVSLASSLVMAAGGTLTFTAGRLAIGAYTLTLRGTVVNTAAGGLRGGASSNLTVDGSSGPTLSMDLTTPATTNALNILTVNAAGQTVTMASTLTISNTLNITAGTFVDGGNQVSSTGTLNLAGTFKLGSASTATSWPAFALNTITAGGTVDYAAGVAQTVSAAPVYQNLTISGAGGGNATGNLAVNGILNLSAANSSSIKGALSTGSYTLNMGSSATTVGQGDVTGVVRRTTILPNISYTMGNEFSSIVFPNTGTLPSEISMKIAIGVTPGWQPGAIKRTYDFIQTGGSGTKAVINAHYLDAELNGNVETKLVDFSYRYTGSVFTEHGKSGFNTTNNFVSLSNVNVAFFSSTFGNVELTLDESTLTTLTWNGSTSNSWITATNWTPNGGPSTNTTLIIPDAATTPNDPSLPATASNGTVVIEPGGILNADPGAQLNLNNTGLAWSNSGTFNAGSSTVTFTDANATMDGTTNFNNVTIAVGAGLQPSDGTLMRIGGAMINNGTWRAGLFPNTVEYNGNNQTVLVPNGTNSAYSSLVVSGTGTTVLPATTLNILGDLTINGAISSTGNTISMNGAGGQSVNGSGALTLNNLIVNNTGSGVNLNQSLTLGNTLTFSSGKLSIGSNTLTLSGNVVNGSANGLVGGAGSNLVVNGTTSPILSMDVSNPGVSNILNNLTINTPGQTPMLGADLSIGGALTFSGGRLGINGKTLTINGPVTNNVSGGLLGGSTSNLIIGGGTYSSTLSFDQSVAGVSNSLNNFTINSDGQKVTLGNSLSVSGTLGLSSGLINTSAGNMLTLTSTAGFTGGSDISFVNGPLTIASAGTVPYTIPVGKTSVYRPVVVTPATAAAGQYTGEYFASTPPAGAQSPMLTGLATDEYWNISRSSGPDAAVTLLYLGQNTWTPGSPTAMDNIVVAQLNAGTWEPEFGSTIAGTTGTGQTPVQSKLLSSFSSFTFGFGSAATLPVTLSAFTASLRTDGVLLNWTGYNEVSLSKYVILRSSNGADFNDLGAVTAVNSRQSTNYEWKDRHPMTGLNYYRLMPVDVDGAFTYSKVVMVEIGQSSQMSVYPNPVSGNVVNLRMQGQRQGNYRLLIMNAGGSVVVSTNLAYDGGEIVKSIVLESSLPAGSYYLQVQAPDKTSSVFKIQILR